MQVNEQKDQKIKEQLALKEKIVLDFKYRRNPLLGTQYTQKAISKQAELLNTTSLFNIIDE